MLRSFFCPAACSEIHVVVVNVVQCVANNAFCCLEGRRPRRLRERILCCCFCVNSPGLALRVVGFVYTWHNQFIKVELAVVGVSG